MPTTISPLVNDGRRSTKEDPAHEERPVAPLVAQTVMPKSVSRPLAYLCVYIIVGFAVGTLIGKIINMADWALPAEHFITPAFESPRWPYPRWEAGGPRTARPWVQMTRRQAAPGGDANASIPVLQTFSVDVPLLGLNGTVVGGGTPAGFEGIETDLDGAAAAAGCQVTLGVNVFANSFGAPFVGSYTPPTCLGDSNTVVMNLTVQSKGRQFDRLAIV